MKTMPVLSSVFVLALVLALCAPAGASTMYSGQLLSTEQELVSDWKTPNGPPSPTGVSWVVTYDGQNQLWEYAYTFTGNKPDISHAILEVSSGFSGDPIPLGGNIGQGTSDFVAGNPSTYNAQDQGASNPGIPGDVYGLKFEDQPTWSIVTDRAPMWGDFYAKGARTGYSFNSGFGKDTTAVIGNGNAKTGNHAWALVPDTATHVVPIPAGIWLLGTGLLCLFGRKRRARG
ncbi:VPLPA-CTERM sorting domain-containing protein [Desulfoplanes sp.]